MCKTESPQIYGIGRDRCCHWARMAKLTPGPRTGLPLAQDHAMLGRQLHRLCGKGGVLPNLSPVAIPVQELQIPDSVGPTTGTRDDVINFRFGEIGRQWQ